MIATEAHRSLYSKKRFKKVYDKNGRFVWVETLIGNQKEKAILYAYEKGKLIRQNHPNSDKIYLQFEYNKRDQLVKINRYLIEGDLHSVQSTSYDSNHLPKANNLKKTGDFYVQKFWYTYKLR